MNRLNVQSEPGGVVLSLDGTEIEGVVEYSLTGGEANGNFSGALLTLKLWVEVGSVGGDSSSGGFDHELNGKDANAF